VKLAKLRITRDASWIFKNLREGKWAEVARVASGLGGEVASIAGSIALYPLAFAGRDLPAPVTTLAAPKPKSASKLDADRPVILVHGWFHNRTGFLVMKRRLKALGRKEVYAVDLPTGRMGVQRLAAILADKIDQIRASTGATHVDVVAHSLGGLVARWWMHHGGGAESVKHLVTLGSPNKGTALAAFVPVGSGRAINPGSWTLAALALPPPAGVKVTVIWSEMDYLILPQPEPEGRRGGSGGEAPGNSATADWHDQEGHVRMKYVGHLSLLFSRDVFREVWRALGGGRSEGNDE